ncbi:P-loop containing nucleoside triphosphate hydrolase protein [Mariannaea sp. PMI_226]|nr:P-loop containing nucleoside triphosphate hydrolase protein [Mariannaea sp. PMI_226]
MDSSTQRNVHAIASRTNQQAVKSSWKQLFVFTKPSHAVPLTGALFTSALTAGFKTVLAIILGKVFDIIAGYGNGTLSSSAAVSEISNWSLILFGLGVGYWLANSAFLALWVIFGELQADSARKDLFGGLISRDMAWFDSQSDGISSLLIRIQTQTRELQLATSQVLGLLISDIMTSFGSVAIAFYYSWKLTLVLLAIMPISALILSLITRRLESSIQSQRRDLSIASKYATASITAIDLVKVFNGYDQDIWHYIMAIRRAAKHYLVQAQCNSSQMAYISFSGITTFIIGFWYGVVLVNEGISPGHVLATFYAILASFQAIEALMPQWLVIAKGMSAGGFLSTLRNDSRLDRMKNETKGSLRPETCNGNVELTNVSFAYPSNPGNIALNKASFFFPAGEMTFIVGRSGSGKSTIGNLIVRFYQPCSGEILIDNYPLRALDKRWLRENVTLIQQSSTLFNESFAKNIAIGHLHPDQATKAQIGAAVEAALLQSTLDTLPSGYDTKVGPGGHGLSGGQKQRVALARAWLRDAPVLVLDEICSGLDQVSRDAIMDRIRTWRQGKTTIIITHDVSQIREDDFVYVMENSSLAEEGYKRDLMRKSKGGLFAALAACTAMDEPDTPIEIVVASPGSSCYTRSPIDIPPRAWSSRVSHLVVGGLEDLQRNALLSPGAVVSPRLSWGANMSTASNPRTDQTTDWDMDPSRQRPLLLPKSPPPLHERPIVAFQRPSNTDLQEKPSSMSTDATSSLFSEINSHNIDKRHGIVHGEKLVPVTQAISQKQDSSKDSERTSLVAILRTVWPALGRRYHLILILGTLVCVVGAGAIPAFAYCFAQLLGVMWSSGDKLAEGRRWAVYLFVIAVIDGLCTGGGRFLFEVVAQAWIDALRVQALKKILRQPKVWFDRSSNSPGRINECLDRNAEEMRNIVGKFVPIVIVVTLMILIAIIWALIVSWKLTLVTVALGPVVVGAVKGFSVVSGKWEAVCNKAAEDSSAILTEIFLNIRVVRALTQDDYFTRRYKGSVAQTLSLGIKRAMYTCLPYGLYQSLNYPLTALVFYYGTILLARDRELDATSVVQVVNLLLFSVGTATSFLSAMPQVTMAQATASQMLGYLTMPTSACTSSDSVSHAILTPKTLFPVRLNELSFSYKSSDRRPVLQGVSIDIQAGTCLAIVGHSGCGKSTMLSLILGLYFPSPRSVLSTRSPMTFAGCSYTNTDIEIARPMMAYVPQAPFLFPATIAENIAYGLTETSPLRHVDNLVAAAIAAGVHDFIASLPEGYNTVVGDGGQALSGGQAQRVSIARALARKPALLVMDEPTSALDAEGAEMIRQTMQGLVERTKKRSTGMAIVVATHSREMMAIADRIVMLEEGVKVEEGTYQGLLQKSGKFTKLINGVGRSSWSDISGVSGCSSGCNYGGAKTTEVALGPQEKVAVTVPRLNIPAAPPSK